MAKFVLAGKSDCPYYAKAELLADLLQKILPDFRIHKICLHPSDWKSWLEHICSSKGWKHEKCPIVWRELIDRGGKGMLLGGFNDFLEHVQGYYGVSSDMGTDLMMKIASENLRTTELCAEEEEHRRDLLKPFNIWICRNVPTISLHLLDMDGTEESLLALKMDVEDLALSQLHEVTISCDLSQVFLAADLIIFLDDGPPTHGGREGLSSEELLLTKVAERYRLYGQLMEDSAHPGVRAVVAGRVCVNLKCSLLIENASSITPAHIVAVATQLEGEAKAQLAEKLAVRSPDITDVIVWGNISGTFHVDLQKAKVFRHKGAICGPAGFSRPVLEMVHDRKWLKDDFPTLVASRHSAIALRIKKPAAISASRSIVSVLHAWYNSPSPQEIFSLGVVSTGLFGVPVGLVFSVPVSICHGTWSVRSDITIDSELKSKLDVAINELMVEKDTADGIRKNDPVT
ncbi:putative malate dehydrogenase 1B isoform X2 [Brachyhypopomus gauderio]|uniref:putative malate dehydrogenase 1B isoform X2 n=1 Tax=Brachyhypopomus gauderio TaxID=698409 RepID=UPI0040427705